MEEKIQMDLAVTYWIYALKLSVFMYILAAPMIRHDSTCMLNTYEVRVAFLLVSAAVVVFDLTLGLLMAIASLIMIGSFNYDAATRAVVSDHVTFATPPKPVEAMTRHPSEDIENVDDPVLVHTSKLVAKSGRSAASAPGSVPASAPAAEEGVDRVAAQTAHVPRLQTQARRAGADADVGVCGSTTEVYERLDFLNSPSLNPDGFVSRESLERVQSNLVSAGALANVYSPLAGFGAVYTAQGILPGNEIKGGA